MRMIPALALCATLLPFSGAGASAADAVPSGNGGTVALGSHWGPYEKYHGTSFRWVDNDAEIILRAGTSEARVAIACEGGPSLGRLSFALRALDTSHRQVDHVVCDGAAHPGQLLLPVGGAETHYLLHADGGGRRVPGDKRILNFRVFSLDDERGTAGAGDVVDAAGGVRLGAGWYPVERFQDQTFRWMQNDAHVIVDSSRATRGRLRLLLEVGPSVGSGSAALTVRDRGGRVLLRTTLNGRGVVTVPMDLKPGENEVTLAVASANKRVPHEGRILNLRLFAASAQR